jgi:molybdopterin synthase catalytic subunit
MDKSVAAAPQNAAHETTEDFMGTSIYILISPNDLSLDALVGMVADDEAGAIATFSGVTRNTFNGKGVLRLEYEAYEPMALRKMAVRKQRAIMPLP